jgi:sortase (surface protein transpeptidase)
MEKVLKLLANLNIFIGVLLVIIPVGFLLYFILGPKYAIVEAFQPDKENAILSSGILASELKTTSAYTFKDPFTTQVVEEIAEPPLVFSVPETGVSTTGARIRIEGNGLEVDTLIYESRDVLAALNQGVWRDPTMGTPDNNKQPIVLAAHRWGENNLSWDWRNKNLFTEFDQLKGGEIVTITWNNKDYRYRISSIENGTHVSKSSDLIMYTCVDFLSDQKIIVYADIIR